FTKVKTADFRKFGFFEVTPHLDPDHDSTIYATKFDERKPIVFAVSSNTPEEYRDAVKDGILYFNKILGAGKIQVMMAPQDVTAPHPDYNVVQWIEWDGAGFAYADAQADPRTGQTLHGQVFFTSAFVAGSRAGVRRLLRRLDVENESALPKKVLIGLKGMEPQPRCRYEIHENHKNELIGLLSLNASDALILKASQDYVREVVAHEVGHVLGLRHNFAGSHGGTYKVEERDGLFQNYLKDQKTPDHIVPTSSVMDYNDFFEAAMSGDIIADKTRTAFSYDTKALQYLYLGTNVEIEDVPLFCTDSHLDENFDYEECMMFDVGPSRLAWAAYDTEKYLEGLPYQVMESFIRFKAPVKGLEPASVESFNLSAQTLAQSTYLLRPFIVDSLTQNAKLLSVRRLQPSITSWNKNEIESMEKETLQQEILSLGGLSALLQQVPQNFGETAYDKFVELTKKDQYRKGVGLAGQNYEFSDTEISSMKRIAKKIFDQLEEALVKTEARSLIPSKGPFVNHPISEPMAELMQKRIEKLLLSVKEGESKAYRAQVLSKKKNENDVQRLVWMSFELPTFKYSVDTRSVAKDMLTDTRGLALGWNWKALEALGATVPDFYNKPLQGYGFSDFNVKKVPQGMALWLNENSAFAALFSHVPVESCLVPSLLKDWLGDSGEEKKRGGLLY
ncbi:MAG: zinc-dependent metalloprotease, partial [Deltaproteobacteria bacterium]|nr:zinc-dependent metalloprotease [Deltaproteobacteria bacterium]